MRVLLASAGSHGDINPFIALARALRARGHDAALLAAPSFQSQIEEAGITFFRMIDDERDLAALGRDHPDLMHPRRGPKVVVDLLIKSAVRATYARILDLAPSIKPDVIVHHHIVPSAAWAADKAGIPSVPVVLAPMLWFAKGDLFSPMQSSPVNPGPLTRWFLRTCMPSAVRFQLDRPLRPILRELALPKDTPLFYKVSRTGHLNLGLWSPHFRGPCPGDPPGGVICGFPWHDRHGQHESVPEDVERFLRDGEPPILFTLGTAAVHVAGDFYQHAAEACRTLHRRGLLLIGPKQPPPPNMPKGTRAFAYIPFSAVMPRCALNVHHGGIGSTGQALRAGKPTLVIPHAHDQFDNAARLKRLGLSDTLPRAKVTAKRLAVAIGAMLHNAPAATLAERIGAAVALEDGAHRAAREVERLIAPSVSAPHASTTGSPPTRDTRP